MSDEYAFNRWPSMAGTAKRCPKCSTLETQLAAVTAQLETERLRLAACGVAALGYYKRGESLATEVWSGSLDDVLKLREQLAEVTAENAWMLSRLVSIAEAFQYPQDDVKDFDHVRAVLDVLCERDTLHTALRQVAEAADKARIFLKNLTMRTGVDTRVGRDGYKEYERLRDALALPAVQSVRTHDAPGEAGECSTGGGRIGG